MINGKKLALCLGGGSAHGFVHIGVLKALEEYGIKPDMVFGVSAGAIVGGAYACGFSIQEIEDIALKFSRNSITDFRLFPLIKGSLLRSQKVDKFFQKLYGNKKIENCKIKFGTLAVDMLSTKIVKMTKGEVWKAVRASMSVPGVFTPVEYNGMKLIDGGVVENIPISLAKHYKADYIIGVNAVRYQDVFMKSDSIVANLINCFSLATNEITKLKSGFDFLLEPNLEGISMIAFKREDTEKSIKIGYETTVSNINKIKRGLNK